MKSLGAVRLFSKEKGLFYFALSLVSAIVLVSTPTSVCSRTWHINPEGTGDAPTIQAGITAASSGDTVLLAPGTYTGVGNRDVSFLGKGVVVTSEGGSSVTIIDCQGLGRGFVFQNDEMRSAVLEGVTITHGNSSQGGAILCGHVAPVLRRNEFVENTAEAGGAIFCTQSGAPTIESNEFMGNSATTDGGAIFYLGTAAIVIRDNTIEDNTAGGHGGGVYLTALSRAQLLDNAITNNHAARGGGIATSSVMATIRGNTVSGNDASWGGGMYIEGAFGGEIRSNVIFGNTGVYGAGVSFPVEPSGLVFANNTIAYNLGSGIWSDGPQGYVIENTISAFNTGKGIDCGTGTGQHRPTLACSDLFGNGEGDFFCGTDGGGNIHADPQFCGTPADSAYYLHASSPCAAENNTCATLMGAFPVGCGDLPVLTTVRCPGDLIVPAFSTVALVVFHGFTITNLEAEPRSYVYYLSSEGPATLVDNGDPASLAGTTPMLAPLEEYSPPPAALAVPEITTHCDQTVTYLAIGLWNPPPTETCVTTVTFEPPVPVFVREFTGEAVDGGVDLAWSVIANEAVAGFRIYRSSDGSEERELLVPAWVLTPETRTYRDATVEPGRTYLYDLVVVLESGDEVRAQTLRVEIASSGLALHQNTPNPFNPSTTISFVVPEKSRATLSIYDVEGRLVRTLLDETVGRGAQERIWDGNDASGRLVSSGVYFCTLKAGERTLTTKMVMIR